MFINLVEKSFMDVVKNPIITLLLVLYFITLSLLMSCMGIQKNAILFSMVAFASFLFVAIFIAGWLRVIKEISTKNPEEEKSKNLVAMFFESVGENIVPVSIGLIFYLACSIVFAYIAYLSATHYFGDPQELIKEAQASGNVIDFINSLPPDKLIKLYAFPILLMISTVCTMFIFLYYFPSMIFNTKDSMFLKPFIAIKDNFSFIFRHLPMTLGIFISLCCINAFVILVKTYLPKNIIVDVLYIFYVIYFSSFAVMLICNYYGKNYSCNNGADSLGEDSIDDSVSEEN